MIEFQLIRTLYNFVFIEKTTTRNYNRNSRLQCKKIQSYNTNKNEIENLCLVIFKIDHLIANN